MPDSPTGAPLRQQIAEAIHENGPCWDRDDCVPEDHNDAADAVVALLNLTEEEALLDTRDDERLIFTGYGPSMTRHMAQREGCFVVTRFVTPWLPSTPPDTNSSEPA